MEKTGRSKFIVPILKDLVEKGIVVPVFYSKGLFKLIKSRISKNPEDIEKKSIAGFFDSRSKKVYIMIENSLNLFGFSSNDLMATITIHECLHMLSSTKPNKFLNIFKSDLIKFYKNLFEKIFTIDNLPNNVVFNIIKFLFSTFEMKEEFSINPSLSKYHKYLQKTLEKYSKLDSQEFNKVLVDYIVIVKLYLLNFSTFLRASRMYQHILSPIYNSYKLFGEKHIPSIMIQELIYPSEVISILSEIENSSKIIKALKQL